jgi:hypothetical protein
MRSDFSLKHSANYNRVQYSKQVDIDVPTIEEIHFGLDDGSIYPSSSANNHSPPPSYEHAGTVHALLKSTSSVICHPKLTAHFVMYKDKIE